MQFAVNTGCTLFSKISAGGGDCAGTPVATCPPHTSEPTPASSTIIRFIEGSPPQCVVRRMVFILGASAPRCVVGRESRVSPATTTSDLELVAQRELHDARGCGLGELAKGRR